MVKVHVSQNVFGTCDVYIVEEIGTASAVAHVREDGVLEFQPVDYAAAARDVPPTFRLGRIAPSVFSALREALDTLGVKSDSDAKIAGKLEATQAHLSDLRQLLDLT